MSNILFPFAFFLSFIITIYSVTFFCFSMKPLRRISAKYFILALSHSLFFVFPELVCLDKAEKCLFGNRTRYKYYPICNATVLLLLALCLLFYILNFFHRFFLCRSLVSKCLKFINAIFLPCLNCNTFSIFFS